MNKNFDIIYAPIITEKTALMANENKYAFKVDPRANKTQIKQAIESIFNVKVESINTTNSHPKKGSFLNLFNYYYRAWGANHNKRLSKSLINTGF